MIEGNLIAHAPKSAPVFMTRHQPTNPKAPPIPEGRVGAVVGWLWAGISAAMDGRR